MLHQLRRLLQLFSREYVNGDHAPDTTGPVDGHCVKGIVNFTLEQHPRREEEERTAERPHNDCAPQMVDIASGAEGNGSCQGSIHRGQETVVVTRAGDDADLVEHEGGDTGSGRAQGRVDDGAGHRDPVSWVGDTALFTIKTT